MYLYIFMFHSNWFYHNYMQYIYNTLDKNNTRTGNVCFQNSYFLSYKYMYVSICRLIFAAFQINKQKTLLPVCLTVFGQIVKNWKHLPMERGCWLIDWLIDWRVMVYLAVFILMAIFLRQILNPDIFHFECLSVYSVKYGICSYVSSR